MNDAVKIYQLYVENAHAQNEQPKMTVDENGDKFWRLHGKLHREDGPAVEWEDGHKEWHLHGKLHRDDGPAVEWANGHKEWYQHGKRHREDGAAVEWEDGHKAWWLHDKNYNDVNAWAQDVLKMHNKPNDDAAVQKFVRMILTKDDLL